MAYWAVVSPHHLPGQSHSPLNAGNPIVSFYGGMHFFPCPGTHVFLRRVYAESPGKPVHRSPRSLFLYSIHSPFFGAAPALSSIFPNASCGIFPRQIGWQIFPHSKNFPRSICLGSARFHIGLNRNPIVFVLLPHGSVPGSCNTALFWTEPAPVIVFAAASRSEEH